MIQVQIKLDSRCRYGLTAVACFALGCVTDIILEYGPRQFLKDVYRAIKKPVKRQPDAPPPERAGLSPPNWIKLCFEDECFIPQYHLPSRKPADKPSTPAQTSEKQPSNQQLGPKAKPVQEESVNRWAYQVYPNKNWAPPRAVLTDRCADFSLLDGIMGEFRRLNGEDVPVCVLTPDSPPASSYMNELYPR